MNVANSGFSTEEKNESALLQCMKCCWGLTAQNKKKKFYFYYFQLSYLIGFAKDCNFRY